MVLRIGGLASGMDIDAIVGDLMRAERIPLDKLSQKKTWLEWQRDDYRSMNKLLDELDKTILNGISMQSKFRTNSVISSAAHIVTAIADGNAVNTSTNIVVNDIASSTTWVGSGSVGNGFIAGSDTTLTFDVVNGDGSVNSGATIEIKKDDTIDMLVSTFNSSGLGVTAFYDTQNQKFVLTKEDTGSQASLKIASPETETFMANLGFTGLVDGDELTVQKSGTDANFDINGYNTMRSANTFTISGVTYTLQQRGSANISVSKDINSTADMVKGFVDKYNETIEAINLKIAETKYRGFPPLTDEQRKDLSEKEAELWDEKAKSGMLRGDSILSSGLNIMRQDLYTNIETGDLNYSHLSQIGIKTSKNYLDKGKLEIDETKLREALAANPDAVMKIFTGDSKNNVTGLATKLRETIESTVEKIELKAGNAMRTNAQFSLGLELTDVDKRIIALQDRLIKVENRYWSQFSAMEQAINRSNQQSMYLMQQFGGGQ
jgi:flagellar hook-associated protein 2